jgi:hypothetical protein
VGTMRSNSESPWVWLILSPSGGTPLGDPLGGIGRKATAAAYRVEEDRVVRFPITVEDDATAHT